MSGFDVSKILESHSFKRNRAALTSFAYAPSPKVLFVRRSHRHVGATGTRAPTQYLSARGADRVSPQETTVKYAQVCREKTTWFKFAFGCQKISSIFFTSFSTFFSSCSVASLTTSFRCERISTGVIASCILLSIWRPPSPVIGAPQVLLRLSTIQMLNSLNQTPQSLPYRHPRETLTPVRCADSSSKLEISNVPWQSQPIRKSG